MLSDIGFALSGLGFGLLLLLLLTVRKSGLAKYLLILATVVSAIWSVGHITILAGPISVERILLLDVVKQIVWLIFLLSCLKDSFSNIRQVLAQPIAWTMLAIPAAALIVPQFVELKLTYRYLMLTVIALQVLVLLELIFRQSGENRWHYKPLIMFLGATNVLDFVTYADATMVDRIEPYYIAARGYISVALLPFLVLAIRRIKHWGVDIFISREVVLHSSLIMVAGGYLFIMAIAGYAVKYIGGEWGTTIQVVLFVLSLALLFTLFLSNSFRIKIKVFITKHFFANQFDYRVEWLKLTQALETGNSGLQGVYHSALGGIMQAIDYDSGVLLRKDGKSLRETASIDHLSLSETEKELVEHLSEYLSNKSWIIDLEELRYKPFVYEGLKINHALLNDCSFELALPIYQGNELWGIALLHSQQPGHRLNWEIRDYLKAVAAQVASFLLHHEASQEVAENAQFAAFSRMSAFVLHDLKNVLAQIDLILCNAEQHKNNPEFIEDTFETLEHTKARMEKMLRQLTDKNEAQKRADSLVTVSELIESVIERKCAGNLPKPALEIDSETQVVLDQDKFSNVMYHLISNAQQATDDVGFVRVVVDKSVDEKDLIIKIIDNGEGMSSQFIRTRLFKPFDTTKGNAGMGIGAYDAKNFMEKIGGHLDVESEEQKGTTFTLTLPIE